MPTVSRTSPATRIQEMSAVVCCCTSRQQNAHVTESRVVLYRWHPWHGRSVFIHGAVVKHEHAVYRCVLEHAHDSRALEVAQWMFDPAACWRIRLSSLPSVTCEALRELRHLIETASRPDGRAMLQAGHLAIPDTGGACAIHESAALGRSAGVVSPASIDAAMDGLAGRSAPADACSARAAAAPAPPKSSRRRARSGGAR